MPIFLVNCALQSSEHDYAPLWNAMEAAGAARGLDTMWLIDVTQDLQDVNRSVLSLLAPGDRAMIVELAGDTRWAATNLLPEARPWLERRTSRPK